VLPLRLVVGVERQGVDPWKIVIGHFKRLNFEFSAFLVM